MDKNAEKTFAPLDEGQAAELVTLLESRWPGCRWKVDRLGTEKPRVWWDRGPTAGQVRKFTGDVFHTYVQGV